MSCLLFSDGTLKVPHRSGQRGTNVSVIMQGLNIKDACEVLFYRPDQGRCI